MLTIIAKVLVVVVVVVVAAMYFIMYPPVYNFRQLQVLVGCGGSLLVKYIECDKNEEDMRAAEC